MLIISVLSALIKVKVYVNTLVTIQNGTLKFIVFVVHYGVECKDDSL